jgi:death-on-curing protein
MIWVTEEQILNMHADMLRCTGGGEGLRDRGMLLSSLSSPFATFGGVSLFPTALEKAVRLGSGLTQNHPFVDGNKRIGIHAMLVVLYLNGIMINYTLPELVEVSLSLASGKIGYEQLLDWVKNRI